jgi:tetratricopeptide (TPR) repeat protein
MSLAARGDTAAMTDVTAELKDIVAESPKVNEPRVLLARAYTHLQKHEECLAVLRDALSQDKLNPALHYELGAAYIRARQWDEARIALEKSLELEPNQPNAYTYLGAIAMQNGDYVTMVQQQLNAISVDPQDHELPGLLSLFLYQIGLDEIADDFRNRVLTLAPTSPVAYQIEIARAKAIGDLEGSIEAARRAVEDDIEDRRFAFGGAVQHLVRTAVKTGRAEEEMAWIDELHPGIFDVDAVNVPPRYRNIQGVAFDGWAQFLPREDLLRRLDVLLAYANSTGTEPKKVPGNHVSILTLRGDIDAAIRVALEEYFAQSVALNLNWRDMLLQPHYAEVVADPRVQDAMQRWEEEEAALRGSVQSYFADFHAAT